MASGLVIHIVAGEDKHTEVLTQERIRIGTSEEAELRLRSSVLPTSESESRVLLELARVNGSYRVKEFDPALQFTHNGTPLAAQTKIKDGDEIRIADSIVALQFFPLRALPAVVNQRDTHVAPFIENAALEAAATERRDDAKVFLREFTRELIREVSVTTKLVVLAIVLAIVGGGLYIGYGLYQELKRNRRVVDDQRTELTRLKDSISQTSNQISDIDQKNQSIIESLSLVPKMRSSYSGGVALITGSFYFEEPRTRKPLRYPEVQTNDEGVVIQNSDESLQLTPDGNGAIAEFEFVGTGFHVGSGFMLTNRHVAQPWEAHDRAQSLSGGVSGVPKIRKIVAYFPNYPQPFPLKLKASDKKEDVAVCAIEGREVPTDLPVLPLDKDSDAVVIGKPVVLMGYPNGPDRLLALRDDAEQRMIQARCGSSVETLLGCLAEKNRIQPLTTQGNITDLDDHRIVYDARTAEGGSGSPLFGASGRVIGINFAIFIENTASNFAVPVRYGIALLQRLNWTFPAMPDTVKSDNSNTSQPPPRPGSATSNTSR